MKLTNRYTLEVIFEGNYETIKDLIEEAISRGADLGGADLGDADLRGADLRGADLRGADLGGADLGDADLEGADLRGADLEGAHLEGADLGDADLRGAKRSDVTIKKAVLFNGLYRYHVMPIIADDDTEWIELGCFRRTVEDWKSDFWNNPKEFPNDESKASREREFAFNIALNWLEMNRGKS